MSGMLHAGQAHWLGRRVGPSVVLGVKVSGKIQLELIVRLVTINIVTNTVKERIS
jgi:hypothetical protein